MRGSGRPLRAPTVAVLMLALAVAACGAGGPTASSRGEPTRTPSATSSAQRTAAPSVQPDARPAARLAEGKGAWVSVSVATLWRSPSSPREVDAPALAAPARIVTWLSAMSTEERRGLSGRADTQALLGDEVRVLELGTTWAKVRVPDQPVPGLAGGYRGWVPRRQLTARAPTPTAKIATVTRGTSWLRDADTSDNVLLVSFGTRLPYVDAVDDHTALVATPSGDELIVRTADISVHAPGRPALRPTRRGLVRTAKQFVGLDYLWAGRSGFGFDCSGLTSLDYRVHGIVIPRDARPQSQAGRAVASGDLARGDLMFYATDGAVHHVSMYAGNGTMVHAPGTGQSVQVIGTSTPAYAHEFSGARRFLD